MCRLICSIFMSLLLLPAFATGTDSLQFLLKQKLPDSSRVKVLKELLYLNNTKEPSQSILYGLEGLELSRKIKDTNSEIQLLNNLGIAYYSLGDYKKTLDFFLLVLDKENELNNPQSKSRALNNLGIIYDEIGRLDKSSFYYQESLDIKRELKDTAGISNTMSNLGLVYMKRNLPEKAIIFFRESLMLDSMRNNITGIYNSLHNIGLYHRSYGDIDSAVYYMHQSLSAIPEDEEHYDKAYIIKSMAQSLSKQQKHTEAEKYFKQSIELATKVEAIDVLKEAYEGLSEIYEKNGDYKNSLLAFQMFKALNDSIFNEDFNRQVSQLEKNHEIQEKEKEILMLKNEADITGLQLSRRKNTNYFLYALGALLAMIAGISYNRYKIKQRANDLLRLKNEEINLQKSEIKEQKDEIETQRDNIYSQKQALEEASTEIMESIWYAQNIQRAILPDMNQIREYFKEIFMIYLPKSIVSGDFYWYTKKKEKVFFAVADCTGHGIPGAFMTVMANDLLNSIIIQRDINDCSQILKMLDEAVLNSLQYKENSANDGLDIALICWEEKKRKLTFSGANSNLLLCRKNTWEEIKGERFSIGGFADGIDKKAINVELKMEEDDQLYLYTDGYPDQFGGPDDKKFMKKRLKNLLCSMNKLPMQHQETNLEEILFNWKGNKEQTDDITLAGIRF
ncbi:tetratricopeptide repeat protein [Marivirga sp. S37H4]|uniref:Tetratricopeptide repeat protein n=1 Tax=Marivirga aurantiaca TaxID=2802615 RepID=A0A935C7Y6_9BACT|nr:tetratricopeptide repeat protein [Marivirga aurantiaca]MBK6264642.1 tetratricopeptide repeat protein [Marivirga aurantiaca]